ncbi:undecaprenyl diphosphate synthase [Tribonema minus]|uniref:Alkyl transferase n=1 Tax=Tribonema minus TaxID=303371 RepID=A0A835ZI19_9STRA|nr:undecaprenyl diphosphate synthase [Tribonema minus]
MVQQLPERSATSQESTWSPHHHQHHDAKGGLRRVPKHVAFVLDGNGRWATRRGLPRTAGHIEGAKRALEVIELCRELGVQYVTLFTFSTENWKRPAAEVASLMALLEHNIEANRRAMRQNGIRLVLIGQKERLSTGLQCLVEEVQRETSVADAQQSGDQMTVCLAVSYGGRDEIARAAKAVALAVAEGRLSADDVTEEVLQGYLSTTQAGVPDPDLIIRTSGEHRISNFLLWQAAYSELYVSAKAWPDFKAADLVEAFQDFGTRQRRFGGVAANSPSQSQQ